MSDRVNVNGAPHGTISRDEHIEAWQQYGREYAQTADEIARRGGFGIAELFIYLGRAPQTWEPDERTRVPWIRCTKEQNA